MIHGLTRRACVSPVLILILLGVLAAPSTLVAEAAEQVASDTLSVQTDTLHVAGSRVSADLPGATRAVQVIDREQLATFPARNVADVLRWATGLDLGDRSRAQADLSIRGAGFEQTLVLVDGVRMNDAQTGHFNLDLTIPLDRVERIEVLRGPASAVYGGDAVGGVVNVVTRRSTEWTARVEGGSFGSGTLSAAGGAELPGSATLEWSGEVSTSDGHRPGTDAETRLGTLTLRSDLAGGAFVVDAGVGDRAFGARDFDAVFDSFEETRTTQIGVQWRSDPDRRVVLEPRVVWREHTDDFLLERDNPEGFRNVHTSRRAGGEIVARTRVHPRLGLALGAGAWREDLQSTGLGQREEDRHELFVEADVAAPQGVRLSGGLRLDGHDLWGSVVSPSIAAAWEARPGLRLRASLGEAFRGPTWTERHYTDPAHEARADLNPERSRSAEVGVRLERPSGFVGDLTLFSRTSRNLIDWARPAGETEVLWRTRNVNRAEFKGAEVDLSLPLGSSTRLQMGGALLSLDSEGESGLESKQALRPMVEQVSLGVEQLLPRGVQGTLRILHGRRPGVSGHREVDVRLEGPIPRTGLSLYLDGRNLLGSEHLDLTNNPVPGRALYVGVRLRGG